MYEVASLDVDKAVDLLTWANASAFTAGDVAALAEVSKAADKLVSIAEDDELGYVVRALAAFARALEGEATAPDELEQVFAWAAASDDAERVSW